MTTRRLTAIEIVVLVIATVVLLMALLSFNVQAQELASITSSPIVQHDKNEKKSGGVTASSDNKTMTKAEVLKQSGVPGKGIDKAPGLQKPFNPQSSAAEHAGKKGVSDNRTSPPPSSDNRTLVRAEISKQNRVPGKGIDEAPALQKPLNPSADDNKGIKQLLYRWQERFQEMMRKYFARAAR